MTQQQKKSSEYAFNGVSTRRKATPFPSIRLTPESSLSESKAFKYARSDLKKSWMASCKSSKPALSQVFLLILHEVLVVLGFWKPYRKSVRRLEIRFAIFSFFLRNLVIFLLRWSVCISHQWAYSDSWSNIKLFFFLSVHLALPVCERAWLASEWRVVSCKQSAYHDWLSFIIIFSSELLPSLILPTKATSHDLLWPSDVSWVTLAPPFTFPHPWQTNSSRMHYEGDKLFIKTPSLPSLFQPLEPTEPLRLELSLLLKIFVPLSLVFRFASIISRFSYVLYEAPPCGRTQPRPNPRYTGKVSSNPLM